MSRTDLQPADCSTLVESLGITTGHIAVVPGENWTKLALSVENVESRVCTESGQSNTHCFCRQRETQARGPLLVTPAIGVDRERDIRTAQVETAETHACSDRGNSGTGLLHR